MIDLYTTLLKANISQSELAREFDVKRQNVSYWCKKQIPIKWYFKVCDYLNKKGIKIYYVKSK